MLKGIVIIATNHPYYGRMAYNLAVSIKSAQDIPVALCYRSTAINHLTDEQRLIFDQLILLPESMPSGFGTKLYLDELSPFEKTLYLDADMLWLPYRKPYELFKELEGVCYTGITEGKTGDVNHGYYFWADEKEIREVFRTPEVYQWRSEVIYFEKGSEVFSKARAIDAGQLRSVKKFANQIPDELYLNIATSVMGIAPHKYKWTPAYWPRLHKDVVPADLSNYYLISFGSNFTPVRIQQYYKNVLTSACNKLGIRPMFGLSSKRSWMPERQKM